jgi:hypothetical protein
VDGEGRVKVSPEALALIAFNWRSALLDFGSRCQRA